MVAARVRFWGVRGSHPTPLTPEQVRRKISTVVARLRPSDLASPETRERFLSGLPLWLFGTTGGNTSCIEVRGDDNTCIILDAGTGIRELVNAISVEQNPPQEFHIFFTHFHYDHVQGLPFFIPAYAPATKLSFYSPRDEIRQILQGHMSHPYFPVTMHEKMTPHQTFVTIPQSGVRIGDLQITFRELNHPGRSFAYRVQNRERSMVYASDVELQSSDFDRSTDAARFFQNVETLVLDTMYTLNEAIDKYNWGHSSFSLGVDFAKAWQIGKLYLFHHEPSYDDRKLDANLRSARWYALRRPGPTIRVDLAAEGGEFAL